MAEIRVGPVPPFVSNQSIKNGLEVRGAVYQNAAALNNWLITRGGQLLPATMIGAMSASDSFVLNLSLYPRAYAKHRAWIVGGRPTTSAPFQVTITAGSSSTFTFTADRPAAPQIHLQEVATPDDAINETSITIACPAGSGAGFVDCLACFEVPRPIVSTIEDLITPEDVFVQGRPIGADLVTLVENIYDAGGEESNDEIIRRNGLFWWSVPTSAAFSTTSTTYVPIFTLLKPAVLGAYENNAGGAVARVNASVYARRTGTSSTSNRFRVTTTSGHSAEIICNTTSWAWQPGTPNTSSFSVDSEDLSASDGRRSSRSDELTFELKAIAGATVEIAAIHIGRYKQ